MKKIILLVITTLILSSFKPDTNTDFSIVGQWKGIEGEEVAIFTFDKEGYAFIDTKNFKIGGKEFEINNKKGSLEYEVDYSKSPIEIDFIITLFDENKIEKILCIAQKIDNDHIRFAMGLKGSRPTNFKEKENIIFTRVTE